MIPVARTYVILVAAGAGVRSGLTGGKQLAPLAGRPLFLWAAAAFQESPEVDGIVVVAASKKIVEFRRALSEDGVTKLENVVAGGARRQDSVAAGLKALPPEAETVLVHDGARPLVTAALVGQVLAALPGYDGVVPAVPVTDTIKEADQDRVVVRTADRSRLWAVQTPQAFVRKVLEEAIASAERDGFEGTDDASLVERMGGRVRIVDGPPDNFKVTHLHDVAMAEAVLKAREVTSG